MSSCPTRPGQEFRSAGCTLAALLAVLLFRCAVLAEEAAIAEDAHSGASRAAIVAAVPADIDDLIQQLGDESFVDREAATEALIQLGIEAKPHLLEALSSSDAEVRFRAEHALETVTENDFQRRLRAFAQDVDGKKKLSLPGWAVFQKAVGNNRAAREIFVEMQSSDRRLLEQFQRDPKAAGQLVDERVEQLYNTRRRPSFSGMPLPQRYLGTLAALLFVGASDDVPLGPNSIRRIGYMPNESALRSVLSSRADPRSEICHRMVGNWVRRDFDDPAYIAVRLSLALRYDLKEGVKPAVELLKKDPNLVPRRSRSYALLVLGSLGGKKCLPLIEDCFQETETINTIKVKDERYETQLRDVALAVTIAMNDQEPAEFGFERLRGKTGLFSISYTRYMGFRSDEDRAGALEKWRNWQQTQQAAASKPPGKETSKR